MPWEEINSKKNKLDMQIVISQIGNMDVYEIKFS
jgi:hypothetical protein